LKLVEIEGFEKIGDAIAKEASKRFEDWYNEDRPEEVPLPGDYRGLDSEYFKKMLIVRTLRPDRMTTALNRFISSNLPNGSAFTECDASLSSVGVLDSAYQDSGTTIPIYFILSPGANPIKDVEELCKGYGINPKNQFHLVALGQGQEKNALDKLELGHKDGHWVML
jgi:dynein heavy chain